MPYMETEAERAAKAAIKNIDEIRRTVDEALALMVQREIEYRRRQRYALIAFSCFALIVALVALTRW